MKSILHYLLFIIVAAAFTLSSCISSEELNYIQEIEKQYNIEPYKEYRLAVGDYITCSISSSDEQLVGTFNTVLSGNQSSLKSYMIYEDSTVVLPFFGSAKIAGHTIQEAEEIIQESMQESVLDVQVKVYLANNFFYVLANNKQGSHYVYKDNMTIFEALAISQQTTGTMDLTRVSIIRKDNVGKTVTKTFDLRSQDVIQSEFYYIQPNDVIYFPTNKNAFFNITSLGAFTSTMMIPLTFLLYSITYNF